MNKKILKKDLIFGLLPVFVLGICIGFVVFFPDKAVVYSVNTQNTYTANEFLQEKRNQNSVRYQSVYEIPQGIYTLKLCEDKIYVFTEKQEKVYLIKANISEFSANDKEVLTQGIKAQSQLELFEIVEYLES